eukprot:2094527-Rhodomonas_salina.1
MIPLVVQPQIQHNKPQFQYNLYQKCGFLNLISQCSKPCLSTAHVVAPIPEVPGALRDVSSAFFCRPCYDSDDDGANSWDLAGAYRD